MLTNKGVAGKLVTDMTEMTAFYHPHACARVYIYYLLVISVIKKKEEEKDRKIKGFRYDSFL